MNIKKIGLTALAASLVSVSAANAGSMTISGAASVGIGEDSHQDIQTVIEVELGKIADYHDKLEVLQKFFAKSQQQEQPKAEEKKKDDKS